MARYLFINQYASTPEEGYGGRYYYIAKALKDRGEKVLLVTSANHHLLRSKPKFKGLWRFVCYDGLEVLWLKTFPYSKANSPIRVLNWFIFSIYLPFLFVLKGKASQIHYSSPALVGFFGAWILSKFIRAKVIFDVRDVWPETLVEVGGLSKRNLFIRFLYSMESFCYRKATFVSSNLANLDVRLRELGIPTEKFFWIPNGIKIGDVEYSLMHSEASLPSGLRGKKIIGYTGTLGEANALSTMLEAARVLRDDTRYAFLIIGNGKEKSDLLSYCNDHNMENVFFMDAVPKKDIYKLQSLMDILCVGAKPSVLYRYGVSPNKLYEYMYSGVPVIYYIDTPSYHPVHDAGCGKEIASCDVLGFVEAIHELASLSQSARNELASRAKDYIIENHTYEALALRLVKRVEGDAP
jgi:glycosyltransferase involved in cell wall biosynthesis